MIYILVTYLIMMFLVIVLTVLKRGHRDSHFVMQSGGRRSQCNYIDGLKFSSNSDKIHLNDDYSSRYAGLKSKRSWASNPQSRYLSYLEIQLPDYYHIDGLVTRGRTDTKEWVNRYLVEYWDRYTDTWVKHDRVLEGNSNDSDPATNEVSIDTDKIRVYPVKWNKYPSLRIGLIGRKTRFKRCRYYKSKMRSGNNMDRQTYQKLYQKHCLKVPKETFDAVVDNLRKNNKKICHLERKRKELEALKQQCCKIAGELKRLKDTSCPKQQLIDLATRYRKLMERKKKALFF